jgi:2-polyprenyl-3-methyl-5-hydroxy-6-metoxy-1,4-benzoquinol methylase
MPKLNSGFMICEGRQAKALKILTILTEANTTKYVQGYKLKLLDIGTGNGEIAHYLGIEYEVTSIDVTDQRQINDGFTFLQVKGDNLPFPNESFDVVVSNHIIEHVTSADQHLSEIARVVRNDGLVYLATPNRLWPWEVHYRIPLLHYLPAHLFMSLMKRLNRYHEDVNLIGWNTLKQKTRQNFTVTSFSGRICKWPQLYHMGCPSAIAALLAHIPLWIYQLITFIHPTLIVVLRKNP